MLTDKVALVTGGSRGIGKEICKQFVRHGGKVIIGYHSNQMMAEELLRSLEKEYPQTELMAKQIDVTDYQQVHQVVTEIVDRFGQIDVLVNNAAIGIEGAVIPTNPMEDWVKVIETNLIGTLHCIKAVSLHMLLAQSGSIVNVTSIAGISGIERISSYCASKAGVIGLTRSLSKEYAPYNVRVNAVAPGYTEDTGMLYRIPEEQLKKIKDRVPLQRFALPKEIVDSVSFLASDQSTYITGQTLVVDGGYTA
ncbi:3-oxoacyl-[acyl-carrier protein] reductase [Kroppenstedtia eburnea]|uniref:3-oxoacyl-[acyl-carrier protein] reductase n=1 Tax=Kroppenstedtia eburnea TaxID=714067 RepID=A0A1N7PWP6_9BACL|nr:3-oxoacyl-ACP reductase FabG [Kroppenstedtia eburnea]QKI80913.1 glucose 1-dehydrogenase [Kroppenstedtia eburnea]SIT14980.1 3-oxoacyl-[acyl-carrier protein] reductase [Kroppenstedtia eburnea]